MVERMSVQCGGFLRTLSLRDCQSVEDAALRFVESGTGEGRRGGGAEEKVVKVEGVEGGDEKEWRSRGEEGRRGGGKEWRRERGEGIEGEDENEWKRGGEWRTGKGVEREEVGEEEGS